MLQLTGIQMLKDYVNTGVSVYAVLKATRIEDQSKLQKPFGQVDPKEVTNDLQMVSWTNGKNDNGAVANARL